jgi:hypothetical protein
VSVFDPNFVSEPFATASAGYLEAYAAQLPLIKAALPRPQTKREVAIRDAIEYGIQHPREWNARFRRDR